MIYWHYKVSEEINNYVQAEATSPLFAILGAFTCGVFTFLNAYKIDQAIYDIDVAEGRRADNRFIIWLLLSIFVGVGMFMMAYQVQESLNNIWAGHMPPNYNQPTY